MRTWHSNWQDTKAGDADKGGTDMEYRERKEVTPEAAVILWQASRLDLSEDYERAPEILKIHGSVIGTLGTKFLPLCESGKKNIAYGGTADRQEP